MLIQLRPYQSEAIDELRRCIASGMRRIILNLFMAGGKTLIASAIIMAALERGNRSLFLAHRRELIKQCFCELVRNGVPPHEIGIIMAGVPSSASMSLFSALDHGLSDDDLWKLFARVRPGAPIQIGSIDSFRGRSRPPAHIVIIDECHRSLARSYLVLLEYYPTSIFIGLTATPVRTDGRGLGEYYQHIIKVTSPTFLIKEGYLVEPTIWTVPHDRLPDLSKVKSKAGDYDEEELAAVMDSSTLMGDIVDHYERRASGIRTVGFATNIKHSQHLVTRFLERGIPSEHVDGETPTEQRDAIFRRLSSGETLVLWNVDICTEGWNMPCVKVCIDAAPTQSLRKDLQRKGRVLRKYRDEQPIILDHAGNCIRHGLPHEDREYSLEGKKKRQKSDAVPSVKTCECLAVLASNVRQCPMCGHVFAPGPGRRELTEEAGELVQVQRSFADDLGARWDEVVSRWEHENRSRTVPRRPGWVWHEFKTRTGAESIPAGRSIPALTPELESKLARYGELKSSGIEDRRAYATIHAESK